MRYQKVLLLGALMLAAVSLACQAAPASPSPAPASAPAAPAAVSGVAPKMMQWSSPPPMTIDPKKKYFATIKTTDGDMRAELYASEDPITVNNFVFLAEQGFYNDVKFHRIVKGFMVQTGDPTGTGRGGPGYRFKDEPVTRPYTRGTLAMANAGPNTNGSQFFIVLKDYPLPPNYTIFGRLVSGDDVLDKIGNTPVTASPSGEQSQPTENILITSIEIQTQ